MTIMTIIMMSMTEYIQGHRGKSDCSLNKLASWSSVGSQHPSPYAPLITTCWDNLSEGFLVSRTKSYQDHR